MTGRRDAAIMVLALAVAVSCAGRGLPTGPSATPPAPIVANYENAKYGYTVALPARWRVSGRLTRDDNCVGILPGSACTNVGVAVLTLRSAEEEAKLLAQTRTDVGPASFLSYIVRVSVWADPEHQTPIQWVEQPGRGYDGTRARQTSLQGRPAVAIDGHTFVARDDLMFDVEYVLGPALSPEWVPDGRSVADIEGEMKGIVASFRFTR